MHAPLEHILLPVQLRVQHALLERIMLLLIYIHCYGCMVMMHVKPALLERLIQTPQVLHQLHVHHAPLDRILPPEQVRVQHAPLEHILVPLDQVRVQHALLEHMLVPPDQLRVQRVLAEHSIQIQEEVL
jgi:hypothetical protein